MNGIFEVQAASELATIRAALDRIEETIAASKAAEETYELGEVDTARLARWLLKARRMRGNIFGNLFGEPAWDLMLDLFVAKKDEREISTSSACIGAGVPPTTALRWIAMLAAIRIIERYADPNDGRRVFLKLSAKGADDMERLLTQMGRGGPWHQSIG